VSLIVRWGGGKYGKYIFLDLDLDQVGGSPLTLKLKCNVIIGTQE